MNKIIGHKREIEQLEKALESNSLAHAYLFAGIDGIGKKKIALSFASKLLGAEITETTQHPDFRFIFAENNEITIETIRELKDGLKFAPLKSSNRIVIIENAETMNTSAANAALKILEEPPANNYFILITCAPHMLLPTIVSRCQKIDFSPVPEDEIISFLEKERNFTHEQAELAAALGEGSIGRALAVNPALIESITDDLGIILKTKSPKKIIDTSSKWALQKDDHENILFIIHRCFHSALLNTAAGSGTRNQNKIDAVVQYINAKYGPLQLSEKCGLIEKTHAFTVRTYNKQLMFEQLLFSLTG